MHSPGTRQRATATFHKCHPNPLRFQPAAALPLQSPELQETARRLRLVPPALLSCPWRQLRPSPPSYPPSTTAAWPPRSLHPLPHSAPGSRPPRPTRRRSCSQCARFGKSGIFFPSCLQVLVLLVASPGPSCRDAALPRRDTDPPAPPPQQLSQQVTPCQAAPALPPPIPHLTCSPTKLKWRVRKSTR